MWYSLPSEYTQVARAPGLSPVQAAPFLLCQSGFPSMSKAKITSLSSTSPVTYNRSRTMIGDDHPCPSPLTFHTSRGPPSGQSDRSPFSSEMPSRRGPRHCGQSGSGEAIRPSEADSTATSCCETIGAAAGGCLSQDTAPVRTPNIATIAERLAFERVCISHLQGLFFSQPLVVKGGVSRKEPAWWQRQLETPPTIFSHHLPVPVFGDPPVDDARISSPTLWSVLTSISRSRPARSGATSNEKRLSNFTAP